MEGLKVVSVEELLTRAGIRVPVGVPAGQKLDVMPGNTVRVTATIQYQGPALDDVFRAVIGQRHPITGFAEWWVARTSVHFDAASAWATHTLTADITIPADTGANLCDIYVKLEGHTEAGLPEYDGVINVIVKAAQFQNFAITSYEKV